MKRADYKPAHFWGTDDADLEVVSAYLQDTLVQVQNIAWQPSQRRFALVGNRFCWELSKRGGKDNRPFFRVRTGFHFDDVLSVKSRSINLGTKEATFSILSLGLVCTAGVAGADRVMNINCAGGGVIELKMEAINVTLSDLSDPWPTQSRPDHAVKP